MSTEAENTDVSIPVLTGRANASLNGFIVELSSWAVDGADESVEVLSAWAFALVGDVIVDSSSSAGNTSDTIPGGWDWALARFSVNVPGSSVGANDAGESIPELTSWADTSWWADVPDSARVASVNTFSSVPSLGGNTSDACSSVVVRTGWAVSDTVSFEEDGVVFAGCASSTDYEEEVEWEVSKVAESGESEIVTVPDSVESEVGTIVVKDETIESVEINDVSGQIGGWGEDQRGRWDISIEKVWSDQNVLKFRTVSNVADQDSVNLGDGGYGDGDSNTGFVDFFIDDLDFEGGVATEDSGWGNLESLNESEGVDWAFEVASEGQKDVNVFAWNASAQWASVYLVVSGFEVVHIFGKPVETDFSPGGVFPVGSDDEGDDSVAVWPDGFDGEKLVRAVLTFQFIDGWNKSKSYKLRLQVCFWRFGWGCGYSRGRRRRWLD